MLKNTTKVLAALLLLAGVAALACGQSKTPEATATGQPALGATATAAGTSQPAGTPTQSAPAQAPTQRPASDKPVGGVFHQLWADPPTLDPHLTGDTTSAAIVVEIFSGLVSLNTNLELVPDIAERWDIDPSGTVYTFYLRPNARFHDGKPMTAEDFKWSLERAADPATASTVADTYLNDIVGAEDVFAGRAKELTGVRAIDDRTLQITIDSPKAYFLAKLTYPTAYVLDRDNVEKGGRNWFDSPNGTGPFRLKEYKVGERLVLERNDLYYREPPYLDAVEFNLAGGQSMQMYENGEIEITGVGLFDMDRVLDASNPLNKELVVAPPGFSISYVGFNTSKPPFDDAKFRQALNYAVDKELIAKEVFSGLVEPAYGILPPGFPGFNPDLMGLRSDADLAKSLLSQSRYADASTRPRIVVTIPGTGGSPTMSLEVVLEMWRQVLGVEVEIQQVEWATYLKDLDAGRFQAFAGLGWEADYPDPQDFLDVLFHTDSSLNHTAYSSAAVDALLEQARTETDIARRIQLYQRAEEAIVQDAPWLPMWFTGDQYVLLKPYVKGYKLTPMTVPNLREVYFEG